MEEKKISKPILFTLFVILALLWGLSFLFTKVALEELDPIEVMAVRWIIPPIIFGILIALKVIKVQYRGKPLKPLLLLVLFQPILYATCETWGVNLTTSSESSIFIAAVPLGVIVLDRLVFGNKPTKMAALGVFVGFAGVVTCIAFAPAAATSGKMLGYFILMLTILMGSAYNVLASSASTHYSAFEMTIAMTISGGIFFNIQNLVMGNGFHAYQVFFQGGETMWCILFLGAGCGCAAYLIYNTALTLLPATVASCIMTNAINVVGVVAGILIGGDPWGMYTVVGVILTVVGISFAALSDNTKEKKETDAPAEQ